jgi:hypothetical protein
VTANPPAAKAVMPTFTHPVSQLVSTSQFFEPSFKKWACSELGWQFGFNRKLWEYAYIMNALAVHGKISQRGVGFGVGRDPIVPVMLRHGASLVVSDLSDEEAQANGWATMDFGQQQSDKFSCLFVNMNEIQPDLRDFDFLWSCGSLEHIGGLKQGMDFVENAMDCLKPGGIAVHTTEFTLTSNDETFESPGISFYRQKDIEALASRLRAKGHKIELNLTRGTHAIDNLVSDDTAPWEISLRVPLCGHVITSIGLIIEKSA